MRLLIVWEQIVNLAISNGLFAVLFLGLLIYQLKDSRTRENRYQETIARLGDALEIVKSVKEDVEDIKIKLENNKVIIRKNRVKENEE